MNYNILELLEYLFNRLYDIFVTTRFTLCLSNDLTFDFSIWELIVFSVGFSALCFVFAFFLRRGWNMGVFDF